MDAKKTSLGGGPFDARFSVIFVRDDSRDSRQKTAKANRPK
jgi:hypothetical protein